MGDQIETLTPIVFVSNNLTLLLFPPVTKKFSSNCRVVTDELGAVMYRGIEYVLDAMT